MWTDSEPNTEGQGAENTHQSAERWYVLRTMPQHEKRVSTFLQKKGIEHYLPIVKRERRWSDRIKWVDFPIFPGYVFVRFKWFDRHVEILQHHGCLHFIKVEGMPASLSEEEIENLRMLVQSEQDIRTDPAAYFPTGQKVTIRSGPLKGVTGIVERMKNTSRIFVQVPLLNQTVSAEMDPVDLERVII